METGGWKEDLCLCFYVRFSGFSSFSGDPVRIALTLDIASISSISESNMVIFTQWHSTTGPPLAFDGDVLSNYSETGWQMPEFCLLGEDSYTIGFPGIRKETDSKARKRENRKRSEEYNILRNKKLRKRRKKHGPEVWTSHGLSEKGTLMKTNKLMTNLRGHTKDEAGRKAVCQEGP